MKRRDFIVGGMAAGVAGRVWGQSTPDPAKLNRISVMTFCFDDIIKDASYPNDPKRTLDILDAPQMIADRYGVHHVEFEHFHFTETSKPYFKEVRERMKKAKSEMTEICLEFSDNNISAPEHYMRLETIDLTKLWIDYAVQLNCPRVLVNQGSLDPEVREAAIATLKVISDYGKSRKVFVNLENRGYRRQPVNGAIVAIRPVNPTPEWQVLVDVIKAADVHANPDIGGFLNNEERTAGLRVLYQMTSGNSHAHYDPTRYSEADCISISKQVGYQGRYAIETGRNNGPDPYAAVQTVRDTLLQLI